jgi:hypothetical protein
MFVKLKLFKKIIVELAKGDHAWTWATLVDQNGPITVGKRLYWEELKKISGSDVWAQGYPLVIHKPIR